MADVNEQKENGNGGEQVPPMAPPQNDQDKENQPLTEAKLKKMSKQDLLDAGLKMLNEKKTLNADITLLTTDRDGLNTQLGHVFTERDNLLDELATTSAQLDNQKKVTADLLQQLDIDSDSECPDKKKALLLIDNDRNVIEPLLEDGTYSYTVSTGISKTQDITNLLENGHLEEMPQYDLIIIACGIKDVTDGCNGRLVATRLLGVAERIANAGVEVAILGLRPSDVKPGQILLCNSRLGKIIQAETTGIRFIHTDKLYQADRDKILKEDNTLTTDGAQMFVDTLNDIKITGVKRMKSTNPDEKSAGNTKPDNNNNSDEKKDDEDESGPDSDEDEVQMMIKHSDIGPIIGRLGSRIRALRAKTKATIHINDGRKEGKKKSTVRIRGTQDRILAAQAEIGKIIREQRPSFPISPVPKKQKK